MKTLFALCYAFYFFVAHAQYQIGHTTITFNDPIRTGGYGSGGGAGRQIQTEIYYPASIQGNDVSLASGQFPIIVFGHGFAMGWDSYANIWEHYATKGYILAFPRTEGGTIAPPPKHYQFALDLKLVVEKILALNGNTNSIFYNKISMKSAIMGHSMGGGASILATSNNSFVNTVVGLAPAETNDTSAISKATSVTIPALIFSGSGDAATPPLDHHLPIYNNLSSVHKSFVSILGGGHCYFANNNSICNLGEGSSNINITRQEQQDRTFAILDPWFDYILKDNCGSYKTFIDALTNTSGTQNLTTCSASPSVTIIESNSLLSSTTSGNPISYQWYLDGTANSGAINQTFNATINGDYTLEVFFDFGCSVSNVLNFNNGFASIIAEQSIFSISPNPVISELNIHFSKSGEKRIQFMDINGRIIKTDITTSGTSTLDCKLLNPGLYLIEIVIDDVTKRIKFMKE